MNGAHRDAPAPAQARALHAEQRPRGEGRNNAPMEDIAMSFFTEFTTYFAYTLLIAVGHLRDFWGRLTGRTRFATLKAKPSSNKIGAAPQVVGELLHAPIVRPHHRRF